MAAAAAVEAILAGRFGAGVRAERAEVIEERGWATIARWRIVAGPAGTPATVVTKGLAGARGTAPPSGDPRPPRERLLAEWAALAFVEGRAGGAAPGPGPALYGGDRAAGVIVMEDFGAAPTLDELLLGDDPALAERATLGLAQALGGLHALAIGGREEFARRRAGLGVPVEGAAADLHGELAAAWATGFDALNLRPPAGLDDDLRLLAARLRDPGPFDAFVHRDPCPDNCVWHDGAVRLLDFERGGFGHALTDGVYGRLRFPSCWCAGELPPGPGAAMEATYRAALVAGCPAASDDALFGPAVVEGCAFHAITRHRADLLVAGDAPWGLATRRQRALAQFAALGDLAGETGHLPALGASAREMVVRMRALWPEVGGLAVYPAWGAAPYIPHRGGGLQRGW